MAEKQGISLNLDPDLLLLVDALANAEKASRSNIVESLLAGGLEARKRGKLAEQKVNLTLRVTPAVAQRVKGVAVAKGCSVNQAAVELLESGLSNALEGGAVSAVEQLAARLEVSTQAAQKTAEQQAHRLAHLLSRSILENLHNRNLMATILAGQGYTPEQIRSISDTAYTRAVELLKSPPPTTRAALNDILGGSH